MVYARRCRSRGEDIALTVALEVSLGCNVLPSVGSYQFGGGEGLCGGSLFHLPAARLPRKPKAQPDHGASEADSAKVIELVMSIPQGVYEWSTQFAGLPQTSNNLGIVKTERGSVSITAFARSFDPEALERIAGVIESASKNAGAVSARLSSLPPWPPESDSDLYRKSLEAYEGLFQQPMRTEVVHAGLECGYFADKADMEIISIGPTLENVHTPRERLYVPSLERISSFLSELLGQL